MIILKPVSFVQYVYNSGNYKYRSSEKISMENLLLSDCMTYLALVETVDCFYDCEPMISFSFGCVWSEAYAIPCFAFDYAVFNY